MQLHNLFPFPEERKTRRRVGRGSGSGLGCTAGKGNKGQNARAGGGVRPGFEGGQMPLQRRLPKHGFKNFPFKVTYDVINLDRLQEAFEGKSEITLDDIYARGLARLGAPVKVLSRGEVKSAIKVEAHKFSQAAAEKIRNAGRPVKVLNLFAYTGGATLAAAAAGATVTHVDASKGMVTWAKENAVSSGLKDAPIRWLVDDCVKFVEREIRRGNHYDAIIMDPPSYGRGPKGEIWKIEDCIHDLIKLCTKILSDEPLFFLINSYTTGLAPAVLTYMLSTELKKFGGHVDSQEIGLPVSSNGLVLPCGASGRWEA